MKGVLFDAIVSVAFVCLCLIGVRKSSGTCEQDYLERLNAFRGIFAVEIVIGHAVRYADSYLWPFGRFMLISVGFFFFVSAFGMVHSYHGKPNYLAGFCKRKIGYLFWITIFVFAFNFIADLLIPVDAGYVSSLEKIPTQYLKKTNWYMFEQMAFYALFYIAYRYGKRGRIAFIAVVTFAFCTAAYAMGWDQEWYASSWSFVLGLVFGEYYEQIMYVVRKSWMWGVSLGLAAVGMSSLLVGENMFSMIYLRNIMCLAAVLMLVQVVGYIQIKNFVITWLGQYSAEIYLFQFLYLRITEAAKFDYKVGVLFIVSLTLLTAFCLHPIFGWIRRKCSLPIKANRK